MAAPIATHLLRGGPRLAARLGLSAIAAAAVAALLPSCDEICTVTQTRCRGACVDLETDDRNCGICGGSCGEGRYCAGGRCLLVPGCDGGATACGDAGCVFTAIDPAHCGACRAPCPQGATCGGGVCTNPGCAAQGLADCGGACVDLSNNPSHCGACRNACPPGVLCQSGRCVGCAPAYTPCDGRCVDLETDPSNCGVCGNICRAGYCYGGLCP